MKMSEKTLLKKIEQAYKENYCDGSYKVEVDVEVDNETSYVLFYTYETGETIALDIDVTRLGEVKFYSPVHCYYISNFNNNIKSVINVLRMLFGLIDMNKDAMISYYEIKTETEEAEETEETKEIVTEKEQQYFDTDSVQPNKKIIAKIENIHCCPNRNTCCFCTPYANCDYNYKSDSCIKAYNYFIHDCEQIHKHMKAICNPEWHRVSHAALANIDFDMLDEKRKIYLSFYKKWQEARKNLRKCSCGNSYERCYRVFRRSLTIALDEKKISKALVEYFDRQISMVNVECGVWSSMVEVAMGKHDSRKYNRATLRY